MKKLWEKEETNTSRLIEDFTVGQDRELDMFLAPFDVLGSIAHVKMLTKVSLLTLDESNQLIIGLQDILNEIKLGEFSLDAGVEDIHSQVELLLTARLGEVGKKIHMARSRNDQVLLDLKLFLRHEIEGVVTEVQTFFDLLLSQSEKFKDQLMPGYTHLQLAMPSSFGLWFGAYAESLVDDLILLEASFQIVNQNPLGSAAGFGSSFPIDRQMTTELLGFSDLCYNVVYAQMGRGKSERVVSMGLANIAETLSRLSMDVCLFLNQNFAFISFPDSLTTGSSIMPHKKNPDVFEIIRAKCNRMKALPNEIFMMTSNLPSGYHRDLQILKEHVFPAFHELNHCLQMATLMLREVSVKEDLLLDKKYEHLFSVEEVNALVLKGVPFRDAYQQVGRAIADGSYKVTSTRLHHTHEGSIGNLSLSEIRHKMEHVLKRFPFAKVHAALSALSLGGK